MPPHVNARESGIADRHRDAIEETMQRRNCFLFVRPTEYDSTILIEEGFATKSMDIHDKSSNWGPMAGMVPCDPAFNKKATGTPTPEPHLEIHGEAKYVHLQISWPLYQRFRGEAAKLDRELDTYLLRADNTVVRRSANPQLTGPEHALQMQRRFVKSRDGGAQGPKSTIFCLKGATGGPQDVYWVHWSDATKTTGRLIPVWVWAYIVNGTLKPVTGDYDLWMVAPHASAWQRHAEAAAIKDAHGNSTASPYTVALMDEMNAECKKKAPNSTRVFNHGAEAQNYGFTQALDQRLVMFTPVGESRMVDMSQMPAILGDLARMNYLVIHNKRYEELDPRIMNTSTIPAIAKLEADKAARAAAQKTLEKGDAPEADRVKARAALEKAVPHDDRFSGVAWKVVTRRRLRDAIVELRSAKAKNQTTIQKSHGTANANKLVAHARWGLVQAAVKHGFESARMVQFYDDLRSIFVVAGEPPKVLKNEDFPNAQVRLSHKAQVVQHSLQIAAVQGTVGSGQTDPEAFEKWFLEWAQEHGDSLDDIYMALEEIAGRPVPGAAAV